MGLGLTRNVFGFALRAASQGILRRAKRRARGLGTVYYEMSDGYTINMSDGGIDGWYRPRH